MVITIDGVRLSKKPSGVTDITISIINSFSICFPEIILYVFTNNQLHPDNERRLFKSKNLHIEVKPLPFLKTNGLLWTFLKLNQLVKSTSPDIFIEPNFLFNPLLFPTKVKVVTYVHDVVFKEHQQTMEFITRLYMGVFLIATFKRTNTIWINSSYTKERLLYHYNDLLRDKLFYTGSGINPFFLRRINEVDDFSWNNVDLKVTAKTKYMFFVGTIEPRKNITFLLKLFASITDTDIHLVIAGDKGWGRALKEIHGILAQANFPKERVIFTGYVSNDDLIRLYRNAFLFISTSYNEGLGLPQLEAMACGCPVLSPHNSAMVEVVDGAGITINSWDISEWLAAIKKVEDNRGHYITMGYEKLKTYDWNTVIKQFYANFLTSDNIEL